MDFDLNQKTAPEGEIRNSIIINTVPIKNIKISFKNINTGAARKEKINENGTKRKHAHRSFKNSETIGNDRNDKGS